MLNEETLHAIVKAYDVRGLLTEITPQVARAFGAAAAEVLVDEGENAIALGYDMRPTNPELKTAFAEGVMGQGVDVIDIGLASTDMLYYASGLLDVAGAMFTASHNPPEYTGIKFCRSGARPVAIDSGLADLRDLAIREPQDGPDRGTTREEDVLSRFATHVRSFIDLDVLRPVKVGVDAGNGMAGHVVPPVFEGLPFETTELFFELDGTFPNHPANPLEEENLRDLQKAVIDGGLALGLAFDGDADRMFAIDENGKPVPSSLIGAVVAERLLKKNPGETILYNLICSRTVKETIEANGGIPGRTRVGHSFIKQRMAETGAIFAAEHSGHYYFRDNYRADSGLIAALVLLEAVAEAGAPLSEVVAPYDRYPQSGEINFVVDDQQATMQRIAKEFGGEQDWEDGLTVVLEDGWFNLRPSNTEPLLRLNVEGDDRAALVRIRDDVSASVQA